MQFNPDMLDMMTDQELIDGVASATARQMRIRTLVMSGRVPRTEYDALQAEINAYQGEQARREPPF